MLANKNSRFLVAGLLYLQHTFAYSDEELAWTWVENPYWQPFCGETYFHDEPLIDLSSLMRWRHRVGKEWLLTETIEAARQGKAIKKQSFDKIIVDTTGMEKVVEYPTDNHSLEFWRPKPYSSTKAIAVSDVAGAIIWRSGQKRSVTHCCQNGAR